MRVNKLYTLHYTGKSNRQTQKKTPKIEKNKEHAILMFYNTNFNDNRWTAKQLKAVSFRTKRKKNHCTKESLGFKHALQKDQWRYNYL